MSKRKLSPKVAKAIDAALEAIVDQWYLSVSDYYLTPEKKAKNPELERPEELKRFHDESGHRIKFNKGDLDFTYGLALAEGPDSHVLEVSINNKVPNFNYSELVRRLSVHYELNRNKPIEGFKKHKKVLNCDVFSLSEELRNSITVEQREGKADIVRLSFVVRDEHLEDLVSDPTSFMELIRHYCVAPLRSVYAEVFRAKQQRR